jgi:hypothetical protein
MKPSSWDKQLGMVSPLKSAAIQSGQTNHPSKNEVGLDVSHHIHLSLEGKGKYFFGSARQSVRKCILCGFLESDEFGLGGCQALRFQQQVIEVAVTPTAAQQRFDVSIDGFHYPQPYFSFAVVKNSFQMFE